MSEDENSSNLCEDIALEVYDLLATIKDPEFPDKTLGNLKTTQLDTTTGDERMVVNEDDINVKIFENKKSQNVTHKAKSRRPSTHILNCKIYLKSSSELKLAKQSNPI